MLVNTLSRALAERLMLLDFTVGRKGFLGYLKSLAGSNIVKVVPASVDASGTQVNGHKGLKVVCGANTSYLDDLAWVGEKTPMTLADVRISPNNTVKPNIGNVELAEALSRTLPFTTKEDNRPVLQCVLFKAGEGKLKLVSADGFRLAVQSIDFDGEGQVLINRDELAGVANALRKARRVNLSFEASGESLDGMSLIIDTEAIRYKWRGADGTFPDYEKLIPTEANTVAHFDTVEAVKAISSLKALADSKSYPIDLALDNGCMVMSSPDDKGQVTIPASIEGGAIKVRIEGGYLTEALRACGGMVDFKLADSKSPTLFAVDGYQLVVMPMLTAEAKAGSKTEVEAKPEDTEPEPEAEAEKAQAVAEAEAVVKAEKPKRSRKREKVAVA
ncbi:MAG: hypothetical protein A2Y72_02670 [Chloroflexi bacterium RBG_13_53_26]|nr:MAG: hypothetical protein A2Y72_02670 [Chloroflexi bacterium RBG_13_53_26]